MLRSIWLSLSVVLLLCACSGGLNLPVTASIPGSQVSAAGGGQTEIRSVPAAYPPAGSFPMLAHFWDGGSTPGSGEIEKWEWQISGDAGGAGSGNGGWEDATATRGELWRTYNHPGTLVAKLRVTDSAGNRDTQQLKITIRRDLNAAPVAMGDATVVEGEAALNVDFNAEGSYDPDGVLTAYGWEFNDGSVPYDATATEGAASHAYSEALEYNPVLTVTDDDGAMANVAVPIYEVLFTRQYIPGRELYIDLGDGSYLRFPADMLSRPATISVYEGHRYAPLTFYVTAPVRVTITLADGTDAPLGTQYDYGYDTSFGYSEDYDLMYFSAVPGEMPYPMFGWADDHGDGHLLKYAEYERTQHFAVINFSQDTHSSSSLRELSTPQYHERFLRHDFTGLKYRTQDLEKKNRLVHIVFVHGIDLLPDLQYSGRDARSWNYSDPYGDNWGDAGFYFYTDQWWSYADPSERFPGAGEHKVEDLLSLIQTDQKDKVVFSWFYYDTIHWPIFDQSTTEISSGGLLASEISDQVIANNPDAQVVLIGYSMGATVIRSACMKLKQLGQLDSIAGVITLNGVNNGTEWINYALTGNESGWFGVPDNPGPSQMASIYDIKHPKLKPGKNGVMPDGFTNNANLDLLAVINDEILKERLWDTDCYIQLGSFKGEGFGGFFGFFKNWATQNTKVFNGITELRPVDGEPIPAGQSFLRPNNNIDYAFHDGIVASGSQFAVDILDQEYDDHRPGNVPEGWWHDYDHIDVLDRKPDLDQKLQEAIAYIVRKIQPPQLNWQWDSGYQVNSSSWEGTSFAVLSSSRLSFTYSSFLNSRNFLRFASANVDDPRQASHWNFHNIWDNASLAPSMIVSDGRPMACCATFYGGDLYYFRATTATPTSSSQWQRHLVDSDGIDYNDYSAPELLSYNGKPLIIYSGSNAGLGLRMAKAKVAEPTGSSDWDISIIDPLVQAPTALSKPVDAMLIGSRLAVAYLGRTDIWYAFSTADPAGPADWTIHKVSNCPVTSAISLDILDNKPQVCWNTMGLYFARATTTFPDSSSDWVTMNITPSIPAGLPDMFVLNGVCHIVANFHGNRVLQMMKASSSAPNGPADWSLIQFGRPGQVTNEVDAFIYNGLPIIATDISHYQYWLFRGFPNS